MCFSGCKQKVVVVPGGGGRGIIHSLAVNGVSTVVKSGLFSSVRSEAKDVDNVKLSAEMGKCPLSSRTGVYPLMSGSVGFLPGHSLI